MPTHATELRAPNRAACRYIPAAQQHRCSLCTQTPIPWPPMLHHGYFASGFPFGTRSSKTQLWGQFAPKDHSPWAEGRRQPGWEMLVSLAPCGGIFCSISVPSIRSLIATHSSPAAERDKSVGARAMLPLRTCLCPLMKAVRAWVIAVRAPAAGTPLRWQ